MRPSTNLTFSYNRTLANKPQHKANNPKSLTTLFHNFLKLKFLTFGNLYNPKRDDLSSAAEDSDIFAHVDKLIVHYRKRIVVAVNT
jgi:hypothetical protein